MTTSTTIRAASTDPARIALLGGTVLLGLSAGFFTSYEASVTLGLAQVGDATYVETFQALNETIRNPTFGIIFFGSIPAVVAALALNWRRASTLERGLLACAVVFYLGGVLITLAGNVPLNEDLADVETITPATASVARAAFEAAWNRLNLFRTVAFGGAFVALAAIPILAPMMPRERSRPGTVARDSDESPSFGHNR